MMALPDAAATAYSRASRPPQPLANGRYRLRDEQILYSPVASHLVQTARNPSGIPPGNTDAMLLLPLLIVLSTLLLILFLFLICIILLRRRRGISLRDHDGPIDVSREDLLQGDGGFEGIEERWLESVSEETRRTYRQAKNYETQYPPNSLPTDITLSQFLTIQEKGVSAWSFEPEYEALPAVLVHARTELTFLPDPGACSSVQSNLPLPKLNEVYYWEVKMFDLPPGTNVAVGLATKPYPSFRMPGWNRYSIAYHSNGDKSYNYPFTATSFGPALREGDVLGVGYRPRTGTVFFTRNGRKTEEAFAGLSRWNLFPTVGADGPCSVHVNLGQAGFVFIEANVKKWGLAPSVGTLAPPPAYGSERGSILLEAGGGTPHSRLSPPPTPGATTSNSRRPTGNRPRRARGAPGSTVPAVSSPLRNAPLSPPPPFSPGENAPRQGIFDRLQMTNSSSGARGTGPSRSRPPSGNSSEQTIRNADPSTPRPTLNLQESRESLSSPDSAFPPNPPTPNVLDIHLRTLDRTPSPSPSGHTTQPERQRLYVQTASGDSTSEASDTDGDDGGVSPRDQGHGRREESERITTSDPPAYAPINPHIYSEGVHIDLPAEVIQAALEGRPPSPAVNGTRGRR